jgi:hypothetical protein
LGVDAAAVFAGAVALGAGAASAVNLPSLMISHELFAPSTSRAASPS